MKNIKVFTMFLFISLFTYAICMESEEEATKLAIGNEKVLQDWKAIKELHDDFSFFPIGPTWNKNNILKGNEFKFALTLGLINWVKFYLPKWSKDTINNRFKEAIEMIDENKDDKFNKELDILQLLIDNGANVNDANYRPLLKILLRNAQKDNVVVNYAELKLIEFLMKNGAELTNKEKEDLKREHHNRFASYDFLIQKLKNPQAFTSFESTMKNYSLKNLF